MNKESPFKEGKFRHTNGLEILVVEGKCYILTEKLPLSMRLSEFFGIDNWERIE